MISVPAIIAISGVLFSAALAVPCLRQWWRHRQDQVIRQSDSPRFIRRA
jgi:hypothetical protein